MVDDNGAAAPPARLEELRALVDDALRGDCAATAVWYADKLATLSRGAVEDELRLARAYAAGGDPACEIEIDLWLTKLLKPRTEAEWQRAKNQLTVRIQRRMQSRSQMRRGLLSLKEEVESRIDLEANLHYANPGKLGDKGTQYLTGALRLREYELKNLLAASGALAKALHHTDTEERPWLTEAFRPPHIALGIARWMFNGLSYRLPKRTWAYSPYSAPASAPAGAPASSSLSDSFKGGLGGGGGGGGGGAPSAAPFPGAVAGAKLPTKAEDVNGVYMSHFHFLIEESRKRNAQAVAKDILG